MTKLPKGTITVPIIFFEHLDEEEVGLMLDSGLNGWVAQTYQAVRSRNPKALREVPTTLLDFPNKTINVKELHTKATNELAKIKLKYKAFPQSALDIIQKLSYQIDFYERIQLAEGKECESIIIIY